MAMLNYQGVYIKAKKTVCICGSLAFLRLKNCPTAIRRSSSAISSPRCTNLCRATVLNCWGRHDMSRAKGCFPEIPLKITKITNYITICRLSIKSQKGWHCVDNKQSFLGFGGEDILATISPCWIHVVTLSAVQARKGKQKVIFQLSTQSW